jgi:hypothetical protein
MHKLGRWLVPWFDPYVKANYANIIVESGSYLGLASIGLLAVVLRRRVRFAESRFWWLALATLVLLSMGTSIVIDGLKVPLPAEGLWHACFAFRMIRVPARFNLLAVIVAAVIASAGLAHLLRRLRTEEGRNLLVTLLVLLIVADMGMAPFAAGGAPIPPMPEAYRFLSQRDPGAAIVEVPQFHSAGSLLSASGAYWHDTHRLRTTAGYSGQSNKVLDELAVEPSPFSAFRMLDPKYVEKSYPYSADVVRNVHFLDYAWLYLTTHDLSYVVHHYHAEAVPEMKVHNQHLREQLGAATIYDDGKIAIYDRDRLDPPRQVIVLPTSGWGQRLQLGPQWSCAVRREAILSAYSPNPSEPLRFAMEAKALRHSRRVRLLNGDREIASWTIKPDAFQVLISPPFTLDELQTLVLEADGEDNPRNDPNGKIEVDPQPHAYRVAQVLLEPLRNAESRMEAQEAPMAEMAIVAPVPATP